MAKQQQRSPFVKFDDIPGSLPNSSVPKDADLDSIAQKAIIKLNHLQESDLASHATWRDLLSFTGTYRTFYSAATVLRTWTQLSQQSRRSVIRPKDDRKPRLAHGGAGITWVDVDFVFKAQHGTLPEDCMGTASLASDKDGTWRIWMLRTWLECFDGRGHPDVLEPAQATANGHVNGGHKPEPEVYGAIVVGGGQAGLSTGGRLKALGVPYVVLEKHGSVGDVWTNRYESLRWHTSKEYGNLPFGHSYPLEDDYMMPAKRIGAGQKQWAEKYDVNVQTGSTVKETTFDETSKIWTVGVSRSDGSQETLRAKNLVITIGTGHSTPVYPSWATPEKVEASTFKGTVVHAFAGYSSAHNWAGKRGVVIGTANTGHDIAEDMANAGMETTIVQRSPTFVFPAEWLHASEDRNYNPDTSAEVADREEFTYPNKILREVVNNHVWAGIKSSPERFDALEKAGFMLDRFGDTYNNLYVRFGGHYVDIGASARIAKGEIKVRKGPIKGLTEDGLIFEDGGELGADLIVLCTGFDHVFRNDAARIVGREVAEQMDELFGTDAEGEIRGHAKPAGHPNLYYHGGDVRMARFFSRFLALQIQADVLGQPLVPYLD
ncbi:uncharacterized protein LTR77_001350 [Saxophila tyrrhenica]|uniref:Flavin-containing monooxygenase n=1 Tax=Saxophila tyrrhenica TaxID=1690608 RepID=A0AAV9PKK0_9PEZI|nr:hypothetical protein LTR77_001350 [Saxophila tyrrhenica]